VALARAMVIEPDLLLMDEPLGALDRQLRKHVQLEIRRLHVARRRTTIYVTHDQEEALVMSDRVAVMSQGRLEQVGTPTELYRNPVNAFVATFLGESNLLPVQVVARGAAGATVALERGAGTWDVEQAGDVPVGPAAWMLVRPEDFRVAADGETGLPAEITEVVYLGEITAFGVRLATGQDAWVRQMRPPALVVGDKIRVRWDPGNVRLLERSGGADLKGSKKP
jgi:ABC-type Fe3+/spermidine/putrescine transport system ATPase subunit